MHGVPISIVVPPERAYEAVKDEARLIQDSLLPKGTLRGDNFEIAFRYTPLGEVGGDFADFYHLPNGLVGLYIGDVVGKGVTAALYAALVMGALRAIHKTGTDPAMVLALLNKRLSVRPVPGRFSSTLYAVFDPASGELAFSNAGIPLPMLVSRDGCELLGIGGFPSAMFPVASYQTHRVRLLPGDAILLATDGLHEIQNDREEDLSAGKLEEIWKACRSKSADQALDFLFQEISEFAPAGRHHDDITAIVLKVPANASYGAHVENSESIVSPYPAQP
jgi:sigma-B regulation protein RsbU (phosphoserine phosphatase)